jgi:hypothetical protein
MFDKAIGAQQALPCLGLEHMKVHGRPVQKQVYHFWVTTKMFMVPDRKMQVLIQTKQRQILDILSGVP